MGSNQPNTNILGQILQSMQAMALRIDRAGACRFADEASLASITGLAHNFSPRTSISQTLAAEIRRQAPAGIDLETLDAPLQFDVDASTGDGDSRHVRIFILPATDRDGEHDGALVFCYDITEQKQGELALQREKSTLDLLLACTNRANRTNDFREALRDCLEIICSFENWLYDGWLVAHAYLVDEQDPDNLVSSEIWCCQDRDKIRPFIELTRNTALRRGVGIPGKVLETAEPIWHGRSSNYHKLPRAALADECGLVSLVAIPACDGDRVVAVLELFADDERPPNEQLLQVLLAIGRELGSVHHREQSNRELRRLADHDTLTGLVVMRIARDRIARALAWADRHRNIVAVLFIDLDGFKQVNDRYGHDTGDELLREVAARLTRNVREVDTVARFGGDEFIVVLSELNTAQDAERIATNIVKSVRRPIHIEHQEIEVTISIGIALCRDSSVSIDDIIHRADEAMYRAKHDGKNRHRLYA